MNRLTLIFFDPDKIELYGLEKRPFRLSPIADIDSLHNTTDPVIGVISAKMVSSHSRQLAAKHKRYLHRTLPYMLEEDIAEDIDRQHVVSQINCSQVRALVISQQYMQSLMQQINDLGINLQALYVDAYLIPINQNPHSQIIQCFNDGCLVKSAEGLLAYTDNINKTPDLDASDIQRPNCSRQQYCAQALAASSETFRPAINLLQGKFALENPMAQRSMAVKRLLAAVAVITVIQVFYWSLLGSYFQQQAELLQNGSVMIYQNYFPNDKTIIDIQRQATGHINAANTQAPDATFEALMTNLGQAISQIPGPKTILLKSMQWQRRPAELTVEIDAQNIAELENIRFGLKQENRLNVDLNQVNQTNNAETGVTGRLKVTPVPMVQRERSP